MIPCSIMSCRYANPPQTYRRSSIGSALGPGSQYLTQELNMVYHQCYLYIYKTQILLDVESDLSLTLLVRSTASMSIRILNLTCGGTVVVQGYIFTKTRPAQNLLSSNRSKARWVTVSSSGRATNLSRIKHWGQKIDQKLENVLEW